MLVGVVEEAVLSQPSAVVDSMQCRRFWWAVGEVGVGASLVVAAAEAACGQVPPEQGAASAWCVPQAERAEAA